MKQIIQIFGIALLMAIIIGGCGLLGSDDDDEEIFLRISNQTGYDISWSKIRLGIGDENEFEVFEFEFEELKNDETNQYFKIPIDPEKIEGYNLNLTAFFESFNISLIFRLRSWWEGERVVPIVPGMYTYILEFTDREFVTYTGTKHQENEEEVRVRVQNVAGVDYDQVSVWLRDDEDFMGREFEIGPVATGQFSSYQTVEDALQFTRIRVVTAEGDTVDNEPLTHFGTELPPADYTYHVDVRTDNLHDNSRIVKD